MTSQSNVRDLVVTGIATQFPDRYLSHYMNDKPSYGQSTNESNQLSNASSGCFFDPHCPECIRELWGPLLSPFAYLLKQNAQYFNEILMRIGQYKVNSISKSSSKRQLKPPKLEYEDHRFLSGIGLCTFHTSRILWLITWTLGFFLLVAAMLMILLNDSFIPPLIVILRMSDASEWGMKFTLQLVFIIVAGIGTGKMLASALGLFGTNHRTGKLMLVTLVLMGMLILCESGVIIYVIITWSDLVDGAESALQYSFENLYGSDDNGGITNAWDRIFQNYECCGWVDTDFSVTSWTPGIVNDIPYSCCLPDASHPGCESTSAPSDQNYANQACNTAIREKLFSTVSMFMTFTALGLIIIIEISSAVLTYLYSAALETARRRRRRHNNRLMSKFQSRLASYTQESTTDQIPSDLNEILPRQDQTDTDDLRQLYTQYSAFHKTPPDMDPSLMSITPTVIQVKRPDVYSYFYYE